MLDLTDRGREELFRRADAEDPLECCGLISSDGDGLAFWGAENKAEDPSAGFAIDPDDMLKITKQAEARRERIIAVYHSHPGSSISPSPDDIEGAQAYPGLTWVIVGRSVCGGCRGEGEVPGPRPEGAPAAATVTCGGCEGQGTVPDIWIGVLS